MDGRALGDAVARGLAVWGCGLLLLGAVAGAAGVGLAWWLS